MTCLALREASGFQGVGLRVGFGDQSLDAIADPLHILKLAGCVKLLGFL